MPIEASYEITKWKTVSASPYNSSSYYNTDGISWGSKPEGSLRISDHWNFESKGKNHCKLKGIKGYQQDRWIMGKYKNGQYEIIKEFKSDYDSNKVANNQETLYNNSNKESGINGYNSNEQGRIEGIYKQENGGE